MSKFNLSEAAKDILLGEDSKSTFDGNIASKKGAADSTVFTESVFSSSLTSNKISNFQTASKGRGKILGHSG